MPAEEDLADAVLIDAANYPAFLKADSPVPRLRFSFVSLRRTVERCVAIRSEVIFEICDHRPAYSASPILLKNSNESDVGHPGPEVFQSDVSDANRADQRDEYVAFTHLASQDFRVQITVLPNELQILGARYTDFEFQRSPSRLNIAGFHGNGF